MPEETDQTESVTPLLFSVERTAEMLSISKKQIYRLMASGDLSSVQIGKRRLITRHELQRYVEELTERAK